MSQLIPENAGGGVLGVSGAAPIASSGGATPSISLNDAGVTYAKIQNVSAADKILGRSTAGAGSVEEIACTAAGRTLLAAANAAAQVAALAAVPAARAINTNAPLSGGGDLSADRTLSTSMATNKLIGRGTAGTGVMEEITLGTGLSLSGTTLNVAAGMNATIFNFTHTTGSFATGALGFTPKAAMVVIRISCDSKDYLFTGLLAGTGSSAVCTGFKLSTIVFYEDANAVATSIRNNAGGAYNVELDCDAWSSSGVQLTWTSTLYTAPTPTVMGWLLVMG